MARTFAPHTCHVGRAGTNLSFPVTEGVTNESVAKVVVHTAEALEKLGDTEDG